MTHDIGVAVIGAGMAGRAHAPTGLPGRCSLSARCRSAWYPLGT